MEKSIVKSADVLEALEILHEPERYAFLTELEILGKARVDAWAFNYNSCYGTAYEIKTNRDDFTRELRNPIKRKWALHVSNYFYFLVPKGLVDLSELPTECGLKEIYWTLGIPHIRTVVQAPYKEANLSNRFMQSILRRVDSQRAIGHRERKRAIFVAR